MRRTGRVSIEIKWMGLCGDVSRFHLFGKKSIYYPLNAAAGLALNVYKGAKMKLCSCCTVEKEKYSSAVQL